MNNDANEYILTFRQISPVIKLDGSVEETKCETVSQIILNGDGMKAFQQLLAKIAGQST